MAKKRKTLGHPSFHHRRAHCNAWEYQNRRDDRYAATIRRLKKQLAECLAKKKCKVKKKRRR